MKNRKFKKIAKLKQKYYKVRKIKKNQKTK